jgi:hypothetical protein
MKSNRTIQKKWRAGKAPNYDELLAKVRGDAKAETAAKEEAERLKKLPLPEPKTEGKYEARIVQALVEIMTGKPTIAKPQIIEMPETIYQPITLVLSSTLQFYYRVTPDSCSCDGWFYSKQRYNVGKCRHHTAAFPDHAAKNNKILEGLKAAAKPRAFEPVQAKASKPKIVVRNAEDFHDLSKAQMKELGARIESKLKKEYALFDYALVRADNQSITLKYIYKEEHSQAEEAQVQAMIKAAKALTPEGVSVCASCM